MNIVDGNAGLMAAWKRDRVIVGKRTYKRQAADAPESATPAPVEPVDPMAKAS